MSLAVDPDIPLVWNTLGDSWDAWLLTFALVVVVPTWGHIRFRRLAVREGLAISPRTKVRLYVKIICWQWLLVGALLLVLGRHGFSLGLIGEHLGDASLTLAVTGVLLMILAVVFAIGRWRVRRGSAKVGPAGRHDHAQALMPAFGKEMWLFAAVSLTAGICEELLYRGWLVNLLRVMTGSVWAAICVGAVVFGFAHAYQGLKGMLRACFIGLQLAALFVYVDSLIPGQILHAGADFVTGILMATAASQSHPTSQQ
jgi:membrane protease YdiL (CAAX protease family)